MRGTLRRWSGLGSDARSRGLGSADALPNYGRAHPGREPKIPGRFRAVLRAQPGAGACFCLGNKRDRRRLFPSEEPTKCGFAGVGRGNCLTHLTVVTTQTTVSIMRLYIQNEGLLFQ